LLSANRPADINPHIPPTKWIDVTFRGSSISSRFKSRLENINKIAPMAPITRLSWMLTQLQAALMLTKPEI